MAGCPLCPVPIRQDKGIAFTDFCFVSVSKKSVRACLGKLRLLTCWGGPQTPKGNKGNGDTVPECELPAAQQGRKCHPQSRL
jgi:hypothetical protein